MSAQSYCPNCDIVYPMAHECCPLCMLKQVSGVLCDKCGWAMKFPEELCRCELLQERDQLFLTVIAVEKLLPREEYISDKTLPENLQGYILSLQNKAKERDDFACAETEHANRWAERAHKAEKTIKQLRIDINNLFEKLK